MMHCLLILSVVCQTACLLDCYIGSHYHITVYIAYYWSRLKCYHNFHKRGHKLTFSQCANKLFRYGTLS